MEKNSLQKFEDITRIEYHGEPVLTTEQLATAYECAAQQLRQNFNNNRERFVEVKHFYKLTGDELKAFMSYVENFDVASKFAPSLYLWTKRGAARHAKMLNTDKAWEVFEALEDSYFSRRDRDIEDKRFWETLAYERDRLAYERDRLAFERDRLAYDYDRLAFERDRLVYDRDRLVLDRDRLALDREQFEDTSSRRAKLLERAGLFREMASAAKDTFLRDDLIRHAANLLSDKSFGTKF